MDPVIAIVLILVALIAGAACGGFLFYKKGIAAGVEQRKREAEAIVGSAEKQAERIVADAEKDADAKKKSALVEAKDEIHKLRSEADKEIKDRRAELSRQERRMQQKEENLDKKTDNLEKKEETLADTLNRVAKAFPANIRAEKIQKKAAKSGFEFESMEQVLGKVKEELAELEEVIEEEKSSGNPKKDRLNEEFGDLMFSMINLSRFLGLNAENSLTNATNKFINRCVGIELLAQEKGEKLNQMSAEEIDALWQSMK